MREAPDYYQGQQAAATGRKMSPRGHRELKRRPRVALQLFASAYVRSVHLFIQVHYSPALH